MRFISKIGTAKRDFWRTHVVVGADIAEYFFIIRDYNEDSETAMPYADIRNMEDLFGILKLEDGTVIVYAVSLALWGFLGYTDGLIPANGVDDHSPIVTLPDTDKLLQLNGVCVKLGMNPVPITIVDLYMSLARGIILPREGNIYVISNKQVYKLDWSKDIDTYLYKFSNKFEGTCHVRRDGKYNYSLIKEY